jgi:hypothetical protein
LIPLLQWSVYCCDGSDHIIGWSGGKPIITSPIEHFEEPIAVTINGLSYLIHPDSQGVNFQSLFMLDRWLATKNFGSVYLVTEKYFLKDY